MRLYIAICLFAASAFAENILYTCPYSSQHCPKISPQQGIDFSKYAGIWIEEYHISMFGYTCAVSNYSYREGPPQMYNITSEAVDHGGVIDLSNVGAFLDTCDSFPKGHFMYYPPAYVSGENGEDAEHIDGIAMFILKTDYETYGFEYGCTITQDGMKIEIFSAQRRQGTNPPSLEDVYKVLYENGIDHRDLEQSRFDNCTRI